MDRVRQRVALHLLARRHRGLNRADQRLDVAGRGASRERRRHCAATFMPEHNDEPGAEMFYCVLDAAQGIIIDQISGGTDDKRSPMP